MAASRVFLREIEEHIQARNDFAFETTLSGRSYLKLIKRLQAEGWRVGMIFLLRRLNGVFLVVCVICGANLVDLLIGVVVL